jgi:hypothetical protein
MIQKDLKADRPTVKTKSLPDQHIEAVVVNNKNKSTAIDKFDSTEELKNVKVNNLKIYQTNNENFKTISNNNIDPNKQALDSEKNNNIQMMYRMLENRINELEREVSLS